VVFVDTSVWIDFLAGREVPHVAALQRAIGRTPLDLGDLVLTEILQGVRDDSEADRVLGLLRNRCRVMEIIGEHNAILAGTLNRDLRHRGVTIRKTVDLWIATWCIANRVPLLHNDRDFARIAESGSGLRIHS